MVIHLGFEKLCSKFSHMLAKSNYNEAFMVCLDFNSNIVNDHECLFKVS